VAENINATPETLTLLARHESSDIRAAVAQNGHSFPSTVNALSDDPDCDVRYAMAENPWMSKDVLEKLSSDENPFVQNRARRTQALIRAEENIAIDRGGVEL
jgi:hypothetical protein